MQLNSILYVILVVLPTISTSSPTPTSYGSAQCPNAVQLTPDHQAQIVNNYLQLWSGDLSVLNDTFSPQITFHADRFPSSTGSQPLQLNTSSAFGDFVVSSRKGWEKYGFDATYWLGDWNKVALRWRLEGVIGKGAIAELGSTLKPGSPVTYNGTDVLILNCCTGLVDQVDSAQDLITFFHSLGLTKVSV